MPFLWLVVAAFMVYPVALSFADDRSEFERQEQNFYRKKGFITIGDEQSGEYAASRYLVLKDVVVAKGSRLTFLSGTQVFFKHGTGIVVDGSLICQGSPESPVIFTKLEQDEYFYQLESGVENRWNGLTVADSGAIDLHFTYIANSKYGVDVSSREAFVNLDSVMFSDNKHHHLRVAHTKVPAPENELFNYPSLPQTDTTEAVLTIPSINDSIIIARIQAMQKIKIPRPPIRWKKPVQIQLSVLTLAGVGITSYYYSQFSKKNREYKKLGPEGPFAEVKEERQKYIDRYYVGIALTSACAAGFVVTMPFKF